MTRGRATVGGRLRVRMPCPRWKSLRPPLPAADSARGVRPSRRVRVRVESDSDAATVSTSLSVTVPPAAHQPGPVAGASRHSLRVRVTLAASPPAARVGGGHGTSESNMMQVGIVQHHHMPRRPHIMITTRCISAAAQWAVAGAWTVEGRRQPQAARRPSAGESPPLLHHLPPAPIPAPSLPHPRPLRRPVPVQSRPPFAGK